MTPKVSMRRALADPALLGTILAGDSWRAWRTLLIAAMGEALTDAERKLFTKLTGREREPLERCEELAIVAGRRGGKSRAISVLATYIAALCDHPNLVAGETGVCLIIAPDQRQAQITLDYCAACFEASSVMAQLIAHRTADTLQLTNGVSIEVRSSSFRRLRGPTYIAVLGEEVAYLYSDEFSSNADVEILNAVRPGLATTSGPLILASSPYARRGVLWDVFRRHFGPQGDPLILVAQGASRDLNPTLSQKVIDRAMERDAASAAAEYGAVFRTDIESFVSREVVDAATVPGRHELPPMSRVSYAAFTDPSGGSSDAMTLAIGHCDKDGRAVLDAVRERRPPFSPEAVVGEFAELLKSYGVHQVTGDHWGGEFVREPFRSHGVQYELADKPKSDLYRGTLAVLNSGKVELLDLPRLVAQFVGLERRTARGGKDSVDHAPGAHDDVVNAVAGVIALLTSKAAPMKITPAMVNQVRAAGRAQRMGLPNAFGLGERALGQMRRAGQRRY